MRRRLLRSRRCAAGWRPERWHAVRPCILLGCGIGFANQAVPLYISGASSGPVGCSPACIHMPRLAAACFALLPCASALATAVNLAGSISVLQTCLLLTRSLACTVRRDGAARLPRRPQHWLPGDELQQGDCPFVTLHSGASDKFICCSCAQQSASSSPPPLLGVRCTALLSHLLPSFSQNPSHNVCCCARPFVLITEAGCLHAAQPCKTCPTGGAFPWAWQSSLRFSSPLAAIFCRTPRHQFCHATPPPPPRPVRCANLFYWVYPCA